MLDCLELLDLELELLDLEDAMVVANDTAGGLLLLSLATGHPALGRLGRLVLTNSDDQFPDALRGCSGVPRIPTACPGTAAAAASLVGRRRAVSTVAASGLDPERAESFFGSARRDPRVVGDLVAARAGFAPQLLIEAAEAIPRFDQPVLLIWGESCGFFPVTHARRLASEFRRATLVSVPGAKMWVLVDKAGTGTVMVAEDPSACCPDAGLPRLRAGRER